MISIVVTKTFIREDSKDGRNGTDKVPTVVFLIGTQS